MTAAFNAFVTGAPAASALGGTEAIPVIQGGVSSRLTPAQLATYVQSGILDLSYQGTWNASTNSPTLVSGVGTKGFYYKVSVAGVTVLDGNAVWNVGDSAVFDGTTWDKVAGGGTNSIPNSELVQAPARTLKGNITAALANVADVNVTQLQTFLGIAAAGATSNVSRPPGVADNTTAGFTTSSIWQAAGTVYNAATYCAADSAAWVQAYESAIGTPVDVMGATLTRFAGGTVALVKGYVGTAVDVAITIAGVYQIYTINILATGELDNVALGAVMATADANTNALVLKVYDQTGNGNHAALVTATGVPCAINATVTTSTTLTVNSVASGTVALAQQVYGNGMPALTGGTGAVTLASGTGPYTLSAGAALNPGPETMYLGTTTPPYIDWDPLLSRYTLQAPNVNVSSGNTTNRRCLQLPQTMAITSTQNYGVYAVGTGVGSADGQAPVLCAVGDSTVSANYESILGSIGGGPPEPQVYGQLTINRTGGSNRVVPTYITAQPSVLLAYTASTPLTTISVNEQIGTSTTAIPAAALAGGYIFCYGGTGLTPYSAMKLAGLAIFNAAPTAAQAKALRYGAYARFNIFPQVQNTVALVGDSRWAQQRVTPGFGISTLLPRYLGRNWNVYNLGTSSITAAQCTGDGLVPTLTGVAKSLSVLKSPGLNYAVILLGINDFLLNSSSVATVLGLLQTLCAQITNVGFIPILIAELATTSTAGAGNTNLPLLRAAILAQGTAGMNCKAIVDVSGITPLMTPATAAYYYDGIHFTPALHQLLASIVAPYIQ